MDNRDDLIGQGRNEDEMEVRYNAFYHFYKIIFLFIVGAACLYQLIEFVVFTLTALASH